MATTKRFDDTYYSVLEKLSSLQNTINALKDLAESSTDMCHTFDKNSQGLEHEIVTKLQAVGYFGDQQTKIERLQGRITTGRESMRALSKRVDLVKDRIEGWDKADRDWQERTRRRLMMMWAGMFGVALLLAALFLGIKYAVGEGTSNDGVAQLSKLAQSMKDITIEASGNASGSHAPESTRLTGLNDTILWKTPPTDDGPLRALDEL